MPMPRRYTDVRLSSAPSNRAVTRIVNDQTLPSTISHFLGYLSASIPVSGSRGAKVKLLVARTPAIARGELSEASPASRKRAIIENQSPM